MTEIPKNPTDAVKRRNPHLYPGYSRPVAIVEPSPGRIDQGSNQDQAPAAGRFLIRVESRRKRLVDCEGLCCKFIVDCLRYAGIIPDDTQEQATIEIAQHKCRKDEPEQILITVTKIN